MTKVLGIGAVLLLLLSAPALAHDEKSGWVVCETCVEISYTPEELKELEDQEMANRGTSADEDEEDDKKK